MSSDNLRDNVEQDTSNDNNDGRDGSKVCGTSDARITRSNPMLRHRSEDEDVTSIKNEVLQLARMRNTCSQSQSHASFQRKPDVYRIAFDDGTIDDGLEDGIEHTKNCVESLRDVINDGILIDLYDEVIDDASVDLLPSNYHQTQNHHHIYVNQLSLADEIMLAESTASCPLNEEPKARRNNDIFSHHVEETQKQMDDTHRSDRDLVNSHQGASHSGNINTNYSTKNHCDNLTELHHNKHVGKSLHRLIKSRTIMQDDPITSISSIRDCMCCNIM